MIHGYDVWMEVPRLPSPRPWFRDRDQPWRAGVREDV